MFYPKYRDLFAKRLDLMYRNGQLGIGALIGSCFGCLIRTNADISPIDAYIGLFESPSDTASRLYKSSVLGFGDLKRNAIAWAKHLIKRNIVNSDEPPCPIFFDESMRVFLGRISDGKLDERSQDTFIAMCSDRLERKFFFPEISPKTEREQLAEILRCIDTERIMSSDMKLYHKTFLLAEKYRDRICEFRSENGKVSAFCGSERLLSADHVYCRIHKLLTCGDTLTIYGELKSPLFALADISRISVTAVLNGQQIDVPIEESCGSYADSYEKTARHYFFRIETDIPTFDRLTLSAEIGACVLPIKCCGDVGVFRSACMTAQGFISNDRVITLKNGDLTAKKLDIEAQIVYYPERSVTELRRRAYSLRDCRIWLYSDYKSVERDNGWFQFCHDTAKNDGIERYYITHHEPEKYPAELRDKLVRFGSERHRELFLAAEKLLAAFVDAPESVFPFAESEYRLYSDLFRGEIVYLQHGVLHAHIPWRYSPVSTTFHADRIVVSSQFELDNFHENYHYPKDCLLPVGMPRYDCISQNSEPENRILYAPSWRAYMSEDELCGFIDRMNELLDSRELAELLESNGFMLDVKPHPMFERYSDRLKFKSDRVRLIDTAEPENYRIFVTDFSSYVFDFVYLNTPIVYYFPDHEDFRRGKYQYRELDLPFEKAFGKLCITPSETVDELAKIIANGSADTIYKERAEGFFLPLDNCCERLYSALL